MQREPDCDMFLVHDDDLIEVNGLGYGRDAVSELSIGRPNVFILVVTGSARVGSDDGSPPELQHRDTQYFIW